jgi:hypothetical protein
MLNYFKRCVDLTSECKYKHVENAGSYYTERKEGALFIYFECSNGKLDWKHNFMFPAKPYRSMGDKWYCHRGFLKVWKSIEPYIKDEILDPTVDMITIIGYSHGGAIAQLCHEYVRFNRPDVYVYGYGFGAPRVFWGISKKAVKERFSGFVVVRNGRDLVTFLPPIFFGFRHICDVVHIGEDFTWKEFIEEIEEKGFFTVMKEGDFFRLISDHFDENYVKSLTDDVATEVPTDEESVL